ncbi:hypothetical protein SBA3_3270010 [Candidatus Sulfopaludibacter sp. SbA3]|nr:hypothetical protein SBA3_3270010 [Candidatus Sulfopaludibacter sp. SbA3]
MSPVLLVAESLDQAHRSTATPYPGKVMLFPAGDPDSTSLIARGKVTVAACLP